MSSQEPDQWEPETEDEVETGQGEEVSFLIITKEASSSSPCSRWRTTRQEMQLLLPLLRWELKLNLVTNPSLRIPLSRHAPDTGWSWMWSYTATLPPTRWIFHLSFILCTDLIHLQVDAEIEVVGESENEAETEVKRMFLLQ